jgi:hypothetical protein
MIYARIQNTHVYGIRDGQPIQMGGWAQLDVGVHRGADCSLFYQ